MLTKDLGMIKALWWRDMLRLVREPLRWVGVVIHPLLVWIFIGYGIDSSFGANFGSAQQNYLHYFFPGIMVMSILFTTIYATMSIIEDRSMGFLQSVLVAPGSRGALVLGKIMGVTSIGLIQSLIFLILAPWAGYSYGDISWIGVVIILAISLLGLTAMNFSFAWIINSTQGYHAVMSVLLIPLWMLSGAIFPTGPIWLKAVMALNPMSYVVKGLRSTLLGTCSWNDTYLPLLLLLIFFLTAFYIAVKVCSKNKG